MPKKPGHTPKSSSSKTANGTAKVEWRGYVTFELEQAHIAAYKKALENGTEFLDQLPKIAEEGVYVVKCAWDKRNKCWVALLYCQDATHPNAGWSLPARSADYWEAQRRLVFLHLVVLAGAWGTSDDGTGWNDDKW